MRRCVVFLCFLVGLCPALLCAQSSDVPAPRVAFVLKNSLGYHRMFRVEGPGIAYGFTMNRNEKTPKNWPVGSRLYFSRTGDDRGGFILAVGADDAGKTLTTDAHDAERYARPTATGGKPTVALRLRNNSLLFRKVALISYEPGETGNGTAIVWLVPYGVTRRRFPAGTRLYLANNRQVETVMSGQRIDREAPFLVVKADDGGQTFDLFE